MIATDVLHPLFTNSCCSLRHIMTDRLRYELRGLAYWAECANPFRRTVTARHLPLGLQIDGYKRDAVGRGLYRRGIHEADLTRFVLGNYSAGDSFLDIGANIGYFSCLFGKIAGARGRVVAIEPEPQNNALLRENIRQNQLENVTVHACAIGAHECTAQLGIYKAANRGRHSLIDTASYRTTIEVPVRRLDDVVRDAAVNSWALLKMDVEGFEPFVLQGAADTLSKTRSLVLEYAAEDWRKAGTEPSALFAQLAPHFGRIMRFDRGDVVATTAAECLRSDIKSELVFLR
jgi:FkbM family methyltransferase